MGSRGERQPAGPLVSIAAIVPTLRTADRIPGPARGMEQPNHSSRGGRVAAEIARSKSEGNELMCRALRPEQPG